MSSRNAASCPSFAHATTCRSLAACRWLGLSFALMTPSPAAEVLRPSGGEAKRSYVRRLFTAIAPRYDFLNHLLSLNVDRGAIHVEAQQVVEEVVTRRDGGEQAAHVAQLRLASRKAQNYY